MDNVEKIEQQLPLARQNRSRNIASGLLLSALALGGGALVADGAVSLTHDLAITTEHAEPSNALAEAFTVLEEAGAVIGSGVLIKRGLRHFKLAVSPDAAAMNNVAHANTKNSTIAGHKVPRVLAASGLLTAFTGIVAGTFFNISNNVSETQSNVAKFFQEIIPPDKSAVVLSNTPAPNVLNTSSISSTEITYFDTEAKKSGTNVIPVNINWAGGSYTSNGQNTYNLEFLTIGLPKEDTGLKQANSECDNVEVNVSSQLGVKPGEFFDLQGLKVKVDRLINGYSGFNLLPVVLNGSDYQRCLLASNNGTYSFAIADGNPSNMESFLKSIRKTNENPKDRLYAVSMKDFINNAETTGKNAVNGLVLEAMLIGMALGAIALNYKTSQDLANNRNRNRMLKANGFDEHLIMKLYRERSELDAVVSAALAMPGTEIVDTLVNHAQPGGALGINLETYIAVTGFLWTISRVGTTLAVRREARMTREERSES